jgi:hypothetical protein
MSKTTFRVPLSTDDCILLVVEANDHEEAKKLLLAGEFDISHDVPPPEPRWHELTGDYIDANLEEEAA